MTTQPTDIDQPASGISPTRWTRNPFRWPLPVRVLLGVAIGTALGMLFRSWESAPGGEGEDAARAFISGSKDLAKLYIDLLTALATPLIFFAIVEAFVHAQLTGRQGMKMAMICAINVAVAFAIGLTILNVWRPGDSWRGTLTERSVEVASGERLDVAGKGSLSPLEMLKSYVPKSAAQPFTDNMVLTVAVLAILVGAAMRSLKHAEETTVSEAIGTFERFIVACYRILITILNWLIDLAPYAICLAVAAAVGALGPKVLEVVGIFLATVISALALHALVYYPLSVWLIGGKSPTTYLGQGLSAILTGFSINSSLATAPLTLETLRRMGVSESSARLSACVGTNFNNDGITLYEAITALFIAQAAGMEMSLGQQATILLAALAGSMGIAGIPNSGFIILTLVLKAAKLPDDIVQLALPIVYSVDVINARLRSAVNVMGDMQVAILLDVGERPAATAEGSG